MIILEGPDMAGKTTLAKKLGLPYFHFDNNSTYMDYLKPLCSLEMTNAVLDRCMISEYPYHQVMKRKFAFSVKEWHNLLLLMLIQSPLIILCVNKPNPAQYRKDELVPYDEWDHCLALYRYFLTSHQIPHIEYDYMGPITVGALEIMHKKHIDKMEWWRKMWREGVGCIGAVYPKVLLVGERLGPNNVDNLPFQVGPTGLMLTNMLTETKTPLGKFTVTNLVKSFRRDTRSPNEEDFRLLRVELENLRPQRVVFMGSVAKLGTRVAKEMGIEHETMVHFGYFNYKKISDKPLHEQWRSIMGITV